MVVSSSGSVLTSGGGMLSQLSGSKIMLVLRFVGCANQICVRMVCVSLGNLPRGVPIIPVSAHVLVALFVF